MRKLFTWLLIAMLLIGNIPAINVSAATVVQSGTYEEDLVSSQPTTTPTQTQKPNELNYDLSNPRTGTDGSVTWDCVWFGNYWQEDTNGDGKADKNDAKQPVKWRVLSLDGNDAFLLADKNLDYQRYNNTYATKITWETCTMRSWLNGYGADSNVCGKDYTDDNFLKNAFTALEQPAIETTNIENNPAYGAVGGNDTQDKIYLLSIEEVCNPAYGFTSTTDKTLTRVNRNTTYTAAIGKYIENNENANVWWLRSLASIDGQEFGTGSDGGVGTSGYAVGYRYEAVRPALHLNLSSLSAWSPAGTVTSEGGGSEIAPPGPGASVTPTAPPAHSHVYVDWKSSAITHWKECSCGEKKDETAHTEDAGTVTKEPTETEMGVRTYKCSVCGYVTKTEEIAMLPSSHTHVYGTAWKSNETIHWKECSCGDKKESTVHAEDNGTITKEPTEVEMGLKTYKCAVCGYVIRTEEVEKHGEGFYEKGNETTTEVETPPEAADIPEDDRITSITINPAFNMQHKDGSNVELDLSKITIKAKEIYDEASLKRAEAALGETLNGNKHYNLLDLTLLYDGKDFSNGYDGLVKVIIPLCKSSLENIKEMSHT